MHISVNMCNLLKETFFPNGSYMKWHQWLNILNMFHNRKICAHRTQSSMCLSRATNTQKQLLNVDLNLLNRIVQSKVIKSCDSDLLNFNLVGYWQQYKCHNPGKERTSLIWPLFFFCVV